MWKHLGRNLVNKHKEKSLEAFMWLLKMQVLDFFSSTSNRNSQLKGVNVKGYLVSTTCSSQKLALQNCSRLQFFLCQKNQQKKSTFQGQRQTQIYLPLRNTEIAGEIMVWHRQVSQRKKRAQTDNLNYGSEWDGKKLEKSVQRLEQKGRTKSLAKEGLLLKNLVKSSIS